NLAKKETLIEELKGLTLSEKTEGLSKLRELSNAFKAVGPVPHAKNNDLWNRYQNALQEQYSHLKLSDAEKEDLLFTEKLHAIKPGPDRQKFLQKERGDIRRQIERMTQEAETGVSLTNVFKFSEEQLKAIDKEMVKGVTKAGGGNIIWLKRS
ncbi:MAG: DUF349 domain-containing protein, partial [Flavobacteriales bacterium]